MFKKVIIIAFASMALLSNFLYASSGSFVVPIIQEEETGETDEFGNPKGYKYYDIDHLGNLCAYKHKWVEKSLYNKVFGEWEETGEYLFKYEIPFNTLWKNRPLTEEEKENLHSGPGVNLAPTEKYGLDGSLEIVGPHRKIEIQENEKVFSKSPVATRDPLNPMKAKSTKKKKND